MLDIPLESLELWDCFSYDAEAITYDYLRGLRCRTLLRDRSSRQGEYTFTIDWSRSQYAEDPGEGGWKCAHIIKLDGGGCAAQPNNRIFWSEPSCITKPFKST